MIYRYSHNAKIVSKRFKDRPAPPSELVIYWFEYILRHKGAYHLNSKALKLNWYQYMLLDVIIFVAIFFIIFAYISYNFFHWFQNYIFKFYKFNRKLIAYWYNY